MRRILAILVAIVCAAAIRGAEPLRPVMSSWTVEAGTSHIVNTYLTPLHYNGIHTALAYRRLQCVKGTDGRWLMQLDGSIGFDSDQNPPRNATMYDATFALDWGIMRRWRPFVSIPQISIAVGPAIDLSAGAIYLSRNGNNPVAAKGSITIDATGLAAYSINLGRLPVTIFYGARLPVAGTFFAPQYGQLYYEIWLGERNGIVHPAWWGNYFAMDNYVALDLRLGGTAIRAGYHNNILSTKVNDIVSRHVTHAFVLGLTTDWFSMPRNRKIEPDAQIIPAL